jgi:hypothetical protein
VSAAPETLQAMGHPFSAAMEARDHKALVDTLAPDVVLHSAMTRTMFDGRETVGEVYAAVIHSFEEIEVVDEFSNGDTHAFFWRGRIEGRFVEGADRLRLDGAGKVREITVVGRQWREDDPAWHVPPEESPPQRPNALVAPKLLE